MRGSLPHFCTQESDISLPFEQVQPMQLLPLFFRLFRCQDKALRHMIFHHIIAGDLVIKRHLAWLWKSDV